MGISTNQKESPICIEHTRCVFVFAVLLNRFSHRQAKELFNYYWQKPTQTRLKRVKKGQEQGNFGSLCSFFSISFFHAVAQEHCMFCGGAFCAWRRIASLVFLQRTLICVLGKRCIGSFLCVQMIQGAINPLCRDA